MKIPLLQLVVNEQWKAVNLWEYAEINYVPCLVCKANPKSHLPTAILKLKIFRNISYDNEAKKSNTSPS